MAVGVRGGPTVAGDVDAVTYRYGAPLYTSVQIILSTATSWGSQSNTRGTLCHEMDHGVGLNHVWYHNSAGIDVIGSKATCIGTGIPTGPSIDDVSALNAVYTNPAP